MEEKTLYIRTLGDFILRYDGKILSGENVRARQVWNLLEFIVVNRGRDTSQDRLIEALWEEDEAEDPANALKNLAYRLRTILKERLGLPVNQYILYQHGSYVWNPKAPCIIDADLLENNVKTARKTADEEEAFQLYRNAAGVYKGSFMPQSAYKQWVRVWAIHYQRVYLDAAEALGEMLLKRERYAEAEEICRAAIDCDPFVEVNHTNLIRALVGANNQKKAREHYEAVCKLYLDELGISPSEAITELYMTVINQNKEFERDLALIKEELCEHGNISGALECNFEMFRLLYRFEARAALRMGSSVYLGLLTVTDESAADLSGEALDRRVDDVMRTICAFLRKNDIVCRYGRLQFLIMLSNITYENMNSVAARLIEKINSSQSGRTDGGVTVHGQIRALDPVELEVAGGV